MIGSRFSPEIRQALRIDISATLLFTVFAGLTGPFIGLILRRELGATPLQLAIMSSAGGACLLLSLLWARAFRGRPPLPYLVWPGVVARGVFLLVPFVSSAWSFVGLVIARDFFAAAAGPAQAAVVERVYPRDTRGRALGLVRMIGAVLGIGLALAAGRVARRVAGRVRRPRLPEAADRVVPVRFRLLDPDPGESPLARRRVARRRSAGGRARGGGRGGDARRQRLLGMARRSALERRGAPDHVPHRLRHAADLLRRVEPLGPGGELGHRFASLGGARAGVDDGGHRRRRTATHRALRRDRVDAGGRSRHRGAARGRTGDPVLWRPRRVPARGDPHALGHVARHSGAERARVGAGARAVSAAAPGAPSFGLGGGPAYTRARMRYHMKT